MRHADCKQKLRSEAVRDLRKAQEKAVGGRNLRKKDISFKGTSQEGRHGEKAFKGFAVKGEEKNVYFRNRDAYNSNSIKKSKGGSFLGSSGEKRESIQSTRGALF